MAVAINDLIHQAAGGGDEIERENLYGENLLMNIHENNEGVRIVLSWTPKTPD